LENTIKMDKNKQIDSLFSLELISIKQETYENNIQPLINKAVKYLKEHKVISVLVFVGGTVEHNNLKYPEYHIALYIENKPDIKLRERFITRFINTENTDTVFYRMSVDKYFK